MNRPALAALLKRSRARLSPADVGMPTGERRRVTGLRREEVAALAGISADYVVRLEQGRGPHPSASVLAGLARALRLSDDQRREMFELADAALPKPGEVDMHVRPSVLRLMDRLSDVPVVVMSAKSDMLAWNPLAAALLGDFSAIPAPERNLVWQRFLGPVGRVATTDEERSATNGQSVASLRAASARYPTDAQLNRLLMDLRTGSAAFRDLWETTDSTPWRNLTKTVAHPDLGLLTLDCDAMVIPESDQTVIIYSAEPDSDAAKALALLRVIGIQDLWPSEPVGVNRR